jgi:ABC-type Na+ transport system ATPase subunit NatA
MEPVIELRNVSKRFGTHTVLERLDLAVPRHSVFGFLGNNGAGKSTTIRLVTGLLQADSGEVLVNGRDLRTHRTEVLQGIGCIVDGPALYPNLNAAEFLRIGCAIKRLPRAEIGRVLELVSLRDTGGTRIAHFSLGMKARLALAHALLGQPRLLVLDEPANGLDPHGILEMRARLRCPPDRPGQPGSAPRRARPGRCRPCGAGACRRAPVPVALPPAHARTMVPARDRRAAGGGRMFLILLRLELLKLRRSLPLLLLVACPLLVVALNTGMALKSGGAAFARPGFWFGFWQGNLALWTYFMLPLYIALVTALLNGNEHKHGTWRLLLSLPVTPRQLYLAKAALAWGCVLGAHLALGLLATLAAQLLAALRPTPPGMFDFSIALALAKISLACLPVVLIQHALSWRFANFVLPLAVGIGATMGIIQLGSSEYWVYFPWSYSLMASNGGAPEARHLALLLSGAVAVALLAWTTWRAGKRHIPA